jgi:hypothetical protein
MTIKEISVEKRVQKSTKKKKDLGQIIILNAVSQSDQYYRSRVVRAMESRYCLRLKTKTAKKIPVVMINFICLPRPFY